MLRSWNTIKTAFLAREGHNLSLFNFNFNFGSLLEAAVGWCCAASSLDDRLTNGLRGGWGLVGGESV